MKRVLISVGIGLALTVVFGIAAGMGAGACHCSTPPAVLFPFVMMTPGEGLVATLGMLQFLIYAVAVALAGRRHWTGPALLLLVIVHVVAAAVALHNGARH